MPLDPTVRAEESKVRRLAAAQGLRLVKARSSAYAAGPYGLVDGESNVWVTSHRDGFGLDLAGVKKELARRAR